MQRNEPSSVQDLAVVARDIIDSNRYMTLATADGDGRPWAAPVWYAHEGYSDFLWVSRPEARHSRNLTSRPGLAIVIFDSTVLVGGAQVVYLEAVAEELSGAERCVAGCTGSAGPGKEGASGRDCLLPGPRGRRARPASARAGGPGLRPP